LYLFLLSVGRQEKNVTKGWFPKELGAGDFITTGSTYSITAGVTFSITAAGISSFTASFTYSITSSISLSNVKDVRSQNQSKEGQEKCLMSSL
jgi:hypothetical protein